MLEGEPDASRVVQPDVIGHQAVDLAVDLYEFYVVHRLPKHHGAFNMMRGYDEETVDFAVDHGLDSARLLLD